MSEAYKNLFNLLVFGKASKFKRLFYDFRKILFTVRLLFYIFYAIPAYNISRIYTVFICVSWTHETIGCHKDTAGKIIKLFLLVLPCAAKITSKMLIFFKTFITMGREHFPVGIYINAKSFGLFKKHFKIFKVMTGNNDEGTFLNVNVDRVW